MDTRLATLWKSAKRDDARALISWLLPRRVKDGWPADGATDIAIRALGRSAEPNLGPGDVMRTLQRLGDEPADGDPVTAFESVYARTRVERQRQGASQPVWTFYWPLRITLGDSLKAGSAVTVLGIRFRFSPTVAVVRRLGAEVFEPARLDSLLRTSRRIDVPPAFLVASQEGQEHDDAWHRLIPAFDTIRGLMEYGFGFGRLQMSFGEPSPRAQIPHPEWMLMKSPGQPIRGTRFITEPRTHPRTFTFDQRHLRVIRQLARALRKSPPDGSTLGLITDALRLYAQAMDDRHGYSAFLGLWQLAERITLSEATGGDTKQVCVRLAWLVRDDFRIPGAAVSHLLEDCAKKRNDIVHRGFRGDVDDDAVNLLKRLTERALLWLIARHYQIPTQADLMVLYQLRTAPDATLNAHVRIARFIRSSRAKDSP